MSRAQAMFLLTFAALVFAIAQGVGNTTPMRTSELPPAAASQASVAVDSAEENATKRLTLQRRQVKRKSGNSTTMANDV